MKKQLFLGMMMIFFIGTSLFAGISDPSKTTAVKDTKENKLSDEEFSRMTRRAETDNLSARNITNKEAANSKSLLPSKQVIVEGRHRHGYVVYGGGTVLLIIILVLILV
jgi:hypothetical protein